MPAQDRLRLAAIAYKLHNSEKYNNSRMGICTEMFEFCRLLFLICFVESS